MVLQRILQEIMKKIILVTSDARPIDPATQHIILSDLRKVAHKIQLTTLTRPKYWCFAVTDCDCNL